MADMEKKGIIDWLKALKFSSEGGKVWRRCWGKCEIAAELPEKGKGRIRYGASIRHGGGGGEFSRGFEQGENLVVLECVCRLLDKGYNPEHLTLEEQWKIGHNATGGRADIVVRDRDDKTMLIIECKTWGSEYNGEKRRMKDEVGQLFSYFQQDRDARYLCLYCSRPAPGASDGVEYKNAIVRVKDRPEDEAVAEKDDSILLYRKAGTALALHEVWKKRFNSFFHDKGIFEDNVNAYEPGLTPLKQCNLIPLADAQGLFNHFAEILRHNNISDNANAFNRMLSLVLCKIVDEEKDDDAVLDFQIREGEDEPEKVQDRLQALYQRGMRRYLGEEIVYHSDEEIQRIINRYPERAPLDNIARMFREIKYYTNNEFAFKEVHNKALFEQNALVLGEVVKMLQRYRFKHAKKQQLLGDFFESLLNHGVKQSQGQFFTPLPVVQFILRSVGVGRTARRRLDEGRGDFLPRVIDYACGAGHFLTECMENIRQTLVDVDETTLSPKLQKRVGRYKESTEWARGRVFGVEKDYRLARTAQIACFLNGDGEAGIIHGDGLEEHVRLGKKKFDILVANPPYSVKDFANYLGSGAKKFRLVKELGKKASEIEALFVERAAQLLAPGGAAGIILPATILSNKGVHAGVRELLLEKFEIRAVAEMGSSTFIATGTKTVILFLRRRRDAFMIDRARIADDCFYPNRAHGDLPDYIDNQKLLDEYARRRGLSPALYRDIVSGNPSAAAKKTPLFQSAFRDFESLSSTKDLKNSATYRNMTATNQKREWERRFRECLLKTEREKFYFFMLCLNDDGGDAVAKPNCYDSQLLAAARSGDDKDIQRCFLGYEFSGRRGSEGLKHIDGQAEGGLMYDPSDDDNLERVSAHLLRRMWDESPAAVPPSLKEHVKIIRLVDCIDFEAENFDKAINVNLADALAAAKAQEEKSRWKMSRLGDLDLDIRKGTAITKSQATAGDIPVIAGGAVSAYYHNKANREGGVITVSASGNAGYVAYHSAPIFASDCTTIQSKNEEEIPPLYVFYYLQCRQESLFALARGSVLPHVYPDDIKNIRIPLPPAKMQKKIAAECAAIDRDSESAKKEIVRLRESMEQEYAAKWPMKPIGAAATSQYGYTATAKKAGSVRFLRITDIDESGEIKTAGKKFIDADAAVLEKYRLSENDVVVARSGSVGRMAIWESGDEEAVFASYLVRLKTDDSALLPRYLFHFSLTAAYWEQVRNLEVTVAQPNLNAEKIKAIHIPLPPVAEQRKIIARLQTQSRRIATLRQQIDSASVRKATVMERETLKEEG